MDAKIIKNTCDIVKDELEILDILATETIEKIIENLELRLKKNLTIAYKDRFIEKDN